MRHPGQLRDTIQSEADTIYRQLTGPEFVSRLEQQGLARQQAQQVASALEPRVNEIRGQLQSASQQISAEAREFAKDAARIVSRAAWIWLGGALLVVGLAFVGGRSGSDQQEADARLREERELEQHRVQRSDTGEPLQPHH